MSMIVSAPRPAPVGAVSAHRPPAPGGLGRVAGTVDNTRKPKADKPQKRLAEWALKRAAAELLREALPTTAKRLSGCGLVPTGDPTGDGRVRLQVQHGPAGLKAHLTGLQSCGNVWLCPICSRRISAERAEEANIALAWARAEGHEVVMLTLTARHTRRDRLDAQLEALKRAGRSFRQSHGWRALGVIGSITATEVTHGANGWHAHTHAILILPAGRCAALEALAPEWLRSLRKHGLTGNAVRAFHVQDATAAGDYVANFGAAEELTLGQQKQGRSGGRSPWQLLADARDGDAYAARLWVEYALAFRGRNQLVWSPGLKAACRLEEAKAEAKAQAEAEAQPPVTLREWWGLSEEWRRARRRRCALLDAAEAGGELDAAEFGPTDAERWRAAVAAAGLLDDEPPLPNWRSLGQSARRVLLEVQEQRP